MVAGSGDFSDFEGLGFVVDGYKETLASCTLIVRQSLGASGHMFARFSQF
jgi:hypothetical protein